jgi:hypothetical protein
MRKETDPMRITKLVCLKTATLLAILAMLTPGIGHCQSTEEIFNWVADQMGMIDDIAMPTVQFVGKKGIQKAFIEGNRNGYRRWESHYGKDEAAKILKTYLDEIVGLFNEKSQTIFIGTFIDPCKQRAVLAHEFVHFFQYIKDGPIAPGSFQEDISRLSREMKAYSIQDKYEENFCQEDHIPQVATQKH